MPHSIFDERGELLLQVESDIAAFAYCLQRQRTGKLTTMLHGGSAEVLFSPMLPGSGMQNRAETALEYKARAGAEAKEEMNPPMRLINSESQS